MTAPIISVEKVRKAYGEKVAVDDVTFAMPPDAILGLLGPNGAGKTSLIRMITTITGLPPDPDRLPTRRTRPLQKNVRR